jgi:acetyl-CoA acetyltransferase
VVRGERGVNAAIVDGARTDFCAAGGRLRDAPAADLAREAVAALDASRVVHVVAACTLPGGAEDLQLARVLAGPGVRATQLAGLDAAGLEALVVGAGFATAGPVLVVGADSASRAPYWVLGSRWGASSGAVTAADPLAVVIAQAGARAAGLPSDRAAEDAWAGADATLKPLFGEDAGATAGTTALPADGAAAALLVPLVDAPAGSLELLAAGATARAAMSAAGVHRLAAVEVHEGTAAEALALVAELGVERGIVNGEGGALAHGHPVAASGIAMALRLRARLRAGEAGLLVAPGLAVACRLT